MTVMEMEGIRFEGAVLARAAKVASICVTEVEAEDQRELPHKIQTRKLRHKQKRLS